MLCLAAVHCAVATAGTNCFNPSCPNSVWKDGTHIVVGMHEGGCCGAFNAGVLTGPEWREEALGVEHLFLYDTDGSVTYSTKCAHRHCHHVVFDNIHPSRYN